LLQQATAAINEVAEETIGKEARKIKKKWISEETMTLLEQKRNLKGNRKKENEYRIIKQEVQTALRKDKELWLEQKCGEVEKMKNKCVSKTDTNPPFAFQIAFPRGTDFAGFLQGGSKSRDLQLEISVRIESRIESADSRLQLQC